MGIIDALKAGFKNIHSNKRLLALIYILNFIAALLIALPIRNLISSGAGNSLAIEQNLERFDYEFLTDLLRKIQNGLAAITNQSILFIFLYFVFSILLLGGIVSIIKKGPNSFKNSDFWMGAGSLFWKYFRLSMYFLLGHSLLIYLLSITWLSGSNIFEVESDSLYVAKMKTLFPIYLTLALIWSLIHDYAKLYVSDVKGFWITHAVLSSFRLTLKKLLPTFGIYLVKLLLFVFLTSIYWIIRKKFQLNTGSNIFIIFLLGQLYLIGRMYLRIWHLAAANHFYSNHMRHESHIS